MWATMAFCFIFEFPSICRYNLLFFQNGDLKNTEKLIFRHYHEEVQTPLHRIAFAYYSSLKSNDTLNKIKNSTFTSDIDSCSHLSPHIVLIIGESYNKHHSTLYGYQQPTTPLQQKRKGEGELFLFSDVVTPWNITSNAFLDVFSMWEYGNDKPIGDYPLFPFLFRKAGYFVSFFSNQYLLRGFRRGATNQAGHFFLADRALSDSLFDHRNEKSFKYDMSLIGQIKKYKKYDEQRKYTLDIVHLIGQHFDYEQRYPQHEAYFSKLDYESRNLSKDAKRIIMHYDNATRYNDIVLDSLISLYERDEAIIVFLSDHGEEVYDGLPVHGRLFQKPTKEQARQEFEIPMWIWCSKQYQAKHPELVARIKESTHKAFMSDGLPQLLLDLAGISAQWVDTAKDLLSPNYKAKRRIIGGEVYYDEL